MEKKNYTFERTQEKEVLGQIDPNFKNDIRFGINMDFMKHLKDLPQGHGSYKEVAQFLNHDPQFYSLKTPEEKKLYIFTHKSFLFLYEFLLHLNSLEGRRMVLDQILSRGYAALCDDEYTGSKIHMEEIFSKMSSLSFNSQSSHSDTYSNPYHQYNLDNGDEMNLFIEIKNDENSNSISESNLITTLSNENCIIIDKKLFLYSYNSEGRLNIYTKAHILNRIIHNSHLVSPSFTSTDFITGINTMEKDLQKLIQQAESFKIDNLKFAEYVEIFVNEREKIPQALKELRKGLTLFQNLNIKSSLKILENLYVKLLGHFDREVRNEAVLMLNLIYDNTTWQEKSPFTTVVRNIDERNKLEILVRIKDFSNDGNILCITNFPSLHGNVSFTPVSEFRVLQENSNVIKLTFDFGCFSRCGYYDWIVVKFKEGRFTTLKCLKDARFEDDLKEAKGRSIVINKTVRDLSVHEVFCDFLNADIDKDKGTIIKRGTFSDLESKIEEYNKRYINCLYIMGALERDNQIVYDEHSGELLDIGEESSSPMAVTCRATVSKLLGGDKAFNSLIQRAKKFSMKIVVDMLTRISSSRYHRKYRNILLHTIDEKGKVNTCYGTDGHSIAYEDSAILNYRKLESWDLIVNDVLRLASKHRIDGIHLDNCQSWPQIMEIDSDEMFRIDPDGQPAYTSLEILNGEIVIRNEDCGYWGSDLIDQYPNPFLIKLTKSVWKEFPQFMFIGECWSSQKFQNRHVVLTRSGIIPRMYTLPRTLSSVFGRRIHRNGYMETCKPSPVSIFKEWIIENNQFLPEGSVVIQSSCGQVWPYPALLHGRGNWSAIDLLFALPDVPMTFMEEINGEAYRVQITNVYEQKDVPRSQSGRLSITNKSRSVFRLGEESKTSSQGGSYLTNSSESTLLGTPSLSRSSSNISESRMTPRVKSLVSLSGVNIKNIKELQSKQELLVKEVGPEFGFDLTKIRYHYDHRRKLRSIHESFRRGKLIFLNVYDSNNDTHPNVLAFARHCPEETGIIAINFSATSSNFKLDLKPLLPMFECEINFNSVCYIEDWITEERGDFYFVREVISEGQLRSLNVSNYDVSVNIIIN
jgi:hypothetical protein